MGFDVYYSDSYKEARQRFLQAAYARGGETRSFSHPSKGPENEELFLDVVRVGEPNGKRVLILISGTHGVEGFCGSACQTAWLEEKGANKPVGVTVYLVHALNPFGFAWRRRVNEDNIDLNRNFLDFASGFLPENPEYRELESLLNPRSLDSTSVGKLDPMLKGWFGSPEKISAFKAAVGKGQYEFPQGIIFGGAIPSWSNVVFRDFIRSLPSPPELGIVLDLHTGLGEAGGLEIFTEEGGEKLTLMKGWFSGSKVTTLGDFASLGYAISGSLYQAITSSNADGPWYCAALEFGTQPITDVLLALQADNWLHCFATQPNRLSEEIRRMMTKAFSVQTKELKSQVVTTALHVIEQALAALGRGGTGRGGTDRTFTD